MGLQLPEESRNKRREYQGGEWNWFVVAGSSPSNARGEEILLASRTHPVGGHKETFTVLIPVLQYIYQVCPGIPSYGSVFYMPIAASPKTEIRAHAIQRPKPTPMPVPLDLPAYLAIPMPTTTICQIVNTLSDESKR